jgi:PPOX class probable FMN-dependent enzyme
MTLPSATWAVVSDEAQLRELVGSPIPRVADKVRTTLHELDREWLAASPMCLVATSAADGTCDVSPRGDPPGFAAHVIDDRTIAIPDRPGNRRVDGFRNVLENPQAGLIFLIPGRGDTLRINGRATLVHDAPFFDEMVIRGKRPRLALVIEVSEVFYHCSKAFLRAALWKPETWEPDAVSSRAAIAHTLESKEETLQELEQYYGPSYADKLYG